MGLFDSFFFSWFRSSFSFFFHFCFCLLFGFDFVFFMFISYSLASFSWSLECFLFLFFHNSPLPFTIVNRRVCFKLLYFLLGSFVGSPKPKNGVGWKHQAVSILNRWEANSPGELINKSHRSSSFSVCVEQGPTITSMGRVFCRTRASPYCNFFKKVFL